MEPTAGSGTRTQDRPRGPLHVCHVVFRLDWGGLENGLVNLINHLPADRFRHSVVSLRPASAFRERIRRSDVPLIEIGKRDGKDPAAYLRFWRALRRLRPDIMHTRNIGTIDLLPVARLAVVARLVHGEHGLDVGELDGRHVRYNRLRRASRLVVDRYVAVSRDLSHWLASEIAVRDSRLSLIYNGVDTTRFRPGAAGVRVLPPGFAPPGAFVVGTVGRFETVKDQATLAAAFLRMLALRPDLSASTRLVMVGDGRQRDRVRAMLADGGAAHLAWLPGIRDDVAAIYGALDVFVLPSRREGISNTLLEAMACGTPVVATRVGGTPEVLRDAVAGRLVPPADPDALAAALIAYADTPSLRLRHGEAARAHVVERFSLDAMVDAYRRLYEGL